MRLSGGDPGNEPALSRWTPDGELVAHHLLPTTDLAPSGWDWDSPGWRHGNLIARTQRAGPPPDQGRVVFVMDLESGEVVRALQRRRDAVLAADILHELRTIGPRTGAHGADRIGEGRDDPQTDRRKPGSP